MTVESFDPEDLTIQFRLHGSVTGFDGAGSSAERFVSHSGQVVIEAEDWCFPRKFRTWEQAPLKPGMKIRWKSFHLADDFYFPSTLLEDDRDLRVTVANGLINEEHTLELRSGGVNPPVDEVVVYTPMIPDGPFADLGIDPGDARLDMSRFSAPTPLDEE